jgi:hypothetical protein
MSDSKKRGPMQLELPFGGARSSARLSSPPSSATSPRRVTTSPPAPKPILRVIQGEGRRAPEPLTNRDAVIRVLVEAGADLLLRRISPERAGEIESNVDEILRLFDHVDRSPALMPVLRKQLDALQTLMTETREIRTARRGG